MFSVRGHSAGPLLTHVEGSVPGGRGDGVGPTPCMVLPGLLGVQSTLQLEDWALMTPITSAPGFAGDAGGKEPANAGDVRDVRTQVRSLGWEDPPEEEMATYSRILAVKILWIEEPGGVTKSQT